MQIAVILLDNVDLLHGHRVEAHGVFQRPRLVKQRDAHSHHVFVNTVDGLGCGDLLFLPQHLRCNTGIERAVLLQVKGGFSHNGAMGEAEVLFIILADPENDALRVGEHHVIRKDQIVFRV